MQRKHSDILTMRVAATLFGEDPLQSTLNNINRLTAKIVDRSDVRDAPIGRKPRKVTR